MLLDLVFFPMCLFFAQFQSILQTLWSKYEKTSLLAPCL